MTLPRRTFGANRALEEFGSPFLLKVGKPDEILQIGVAPTRVDILQKVSGVRFATAWRRRIRSPYGRTGANWIDLESLIRTKRGLSAPRHQEDVARPAPSQGHPKEAILTPSPFALELSAGGVHIVFNLTVKLTLTVP